MNILYYNFYYLRPLNLIYYYTKEIKSTTPEAKYFLDKTRTYEMYKCDILLIWLSIDTI
jgi:hypothetical protein